MLTDIKIENIAVIEKAELNLKPGFNVLTGETGAGKSIIIDSINAILGERTSKELIRTGCETAVVTASFDEINSDIRACLEASGISTEDDEPLIITRSLSSSGKNNCRINGWPVNVSKLKEIGPMLINIHGQHDSQALLCPEKHCSFIDLLADNEKLRSEYKDVFHNLVKVKKELDSLYDSRDDKLARLDYVDFVIKEISDANIRIGEMDELNEEKNLLQNSAKVKKYIENALSALSGENGIAEGLMECAVNLSNASEYFKDAAEITKQIKDTAYFLSDCISTVRNLSDSVSYKPERITEIDNRLDELYRLSMKYGKNEEEILKTYENAVNEKESIDSSDTRISQLENELYSLSDKVKLLADKLTKSRKDAALIFEKNVCRELSFLDMPNVKFIVRFTETPLSSKGKESVEFLISSNQGQEPKPIIKTASGGELSRIMLAVKNVLSDKDPVGTLIFDEIDTGVSGSAAEKIALKLSETSKGKQVICVTHLARIAAQADNHIKISKITENNNTFTKVETLDYEGRAHEIARITAGNDITEIQLQSARELLGKGNNI